MTHNDQCQCTECVASRQQQPERPVALDPLVPSYVGSGGVQVEVVQRELPGVPGAVPELGAEVRRLVELPANAAGATIVGAAVLAFDGHTVALLARTNGKTLAIWYDRDRGHLVSRPAGNVG